MLCLGHEQHCLPKVKLGTHTHPPGQLGFVHRWGMCCDSQEGAVLIHLFPFSTEVCKNTSKSCPVVFVWDVVRQGSPLGDFIVLRLQAGVEGWAGNGVSALLCRACAPAYVLCSAGCGLEP